MIDLGFNVRGPTRFYLFYPSHARNCTNHLTQPGLGWIYQTHMISWKSWTVITHHLPKYEVRVDSTTGA